MPLTSRKRKPTQKYLEQTGEGKRRQTGNTTVNNALSDAKDVPEDGPCDNIEELGLSEEDRIRDAFIDVTMTAVISHQRRFFRTHPDAHIRQMYRQTFILPQRLDPQSRDTTAIGRIGERIDFTTDRACSSRGAKLESTQSTVVCSDAEDDGAEDGITESFFEWRRNSRHRRASKNMVKDVEPGRSDLIEQMEALRQLAALMVERRRMKAERLAAVERAARRLMELDLSLTQKNALMPALRDPSWAPIWFATPEKYQKDLMQLFVKSKLPHAIPPAS